MTTSTNMEKNNYNKNFYEQYRQDYCYVCGHYNYTGYMEEREEGIFYCDRCADLPPYSDELYNGIVGLQRLFRSYFAAKAKPCGQCKKPCLKRHDFLKNTEPICSECLEDELDAERRERECPCCGSDPCQCDDYSWWCDKCEGRWGCECAERTLCGHCRGEEATMPNDYTDEGDLCADCFWDVRKEMRIKWAKARATTSE